MEAVGPEPESADVDAALLKTLRQAVDYARKTACVPRHPARIPASTAYPARAMSLVVFEKPWLLELMSEAQHDPVVWEDHQLSAGTDVRPTVADQSHGTTTDDPCSARGHRSRLR